MEELKRNRFEIAPQALLLAAGVILSVVLISIMVMQFEQAKNMSDVVSGKMIEDTERLRNSGIMQYDGLRVSGAEVRNFYKLYLTAAGPKGFEKLIVKNGGAEKSYISSGSFSELTDTSGSGYVAPTDVYLCTVEQNANGIITNVIFNLEK
ncbi:MAG: hypothetical protein J6U61_10645 [Lachnospiraceae bacterium]|nr:hypothetical protein [Lachnospiraceae bacterium]